MRCLETASPIKIVILNFCTLDRWLGFFTEKKEENSFFAQDLACVTGGLVGWNVTAVRKLERG